MHKIAYFCCCPFISNFEACDPSVLKFKCFVAQSQHETGHLYKALSFNYICDGNFSGCENKLC